MAISQDTISLLFRAVGDTSDAKKAFSDLEKSIKSDVDQSGKTVDTLGGKFSKMGASSVAAGAAGAAAIAAIGAAAITYYKAIFDLTQQTASYITEIDKLSQSTGITTESISGLRAIVEKTGGTFSQIESGLANFNKLVGDAAAGSNEAKEKITLLGLEPQTAINDLDAALSTAVKTIYEYKNPVDRARASNAAFGEELGQQMIPLLKSVNGDMEEAIRIADKYGLKIGKDNVAAANEFDRSYSDVTATLKGVAIAIGSEALPQINALFKATSDGLKTDQQNWDDWAKIVSGSIYAVRVAWENWRAIVSLAQGRPAVFLPPVTVPGGVSGDPSQVSTTRDKQAEDEAKKAREKAFRASVDDFNKRLAALKGYNRTALDLTKQAGADTAAAIKAIGITDEIQEQITRVRELFADFERRLTEAHRIETNARVAQGKTSLGEIEVEQERHNRELRDLYDQQSKFEKEILDASVQYEKRISAEKLKIQQDTAAFMRDRISADNELAIAEMEENFASDMRILRARQSARAEESARYREDLIKERDLFADNTSEWLRLNRKIEILDTQIKTQQKKDQKELNDLRQKEIDLFVELLARQEDNQQKKDENDPTNRQIGPVGTGKGKPLTDGEDDLFSDLFGKDPAKSAGVALTAMESISNAASEMKGVVLDAFQGMKFAVGEAVAQWVLYGGSVGQALKKALAAQLAHVAAMATVKALESTAWGFYHLATLNFPAAANAFISAGLWAALAVGSAFAGRALAGNSFQRESQGGFGSSSGDIDLRRSSNNSSNDPRSITENRLGRQENRMTVILRTERGWFGQALKEDHQNGGEGSSLINLMIENGS